MGLHRSEKINVPTIYYAHERQVSLRDGMWIAITDVTPARPGEVIELRSSLPNSGRHVLHGRRTVQRQHGARRDQRG